MAFNRIIFSIITCAIIIVLNLIPILGCSNGSTPQTSQSPGTNISFELIIQEGDYSNGYQQREALIQVMTSDSPPIPQIPEWIYPYHWSRLIEIDYSQYFAIIVFNGWRGAICDKLVVNEISQNKSIIYIMAHFDDGAATCSAEISSQYCVVKVKRSDLTQAGELTFKLIDETGEERASIVQSISK